MLWVYSDLHDRLFWKTIQFAWKKKKYYFYLNRFETDWVKLDCHPGPKTAKHISNKVMYYVQLFEKRTQIIAIIAENNLNSNVIDNDVDIIHSNTRNV